jgi:ATP-dependent Lon protease
MSKKKNSINNKSSKNNDNIIDNENFKKLILAKDYLPEKVFVLPIMQRPVFPQMILPVHVPTGKYIDMIEKAMSLGGHIILLIDKSENKEFEDIKHSDLYEVGTVGTIVRKMNLPDGSVNILLHSLKRATVKNFIRKDPLIMANVQYNKEIEYSKDDIEIKALMREILLKMKKVTEHNPLITEDLKLTMINVDDPGKLADFVSSILNLKKEDYQVILEEFDIKSRLEKILYYLEKEMDLIAVQQKIKKVIDDKVQKQQKEFFLREQLKLIKKELGVDDEHSKQYNKYKQILEKLNLEKDTFNKIKEDLENFELLDSRSPEYTVQKNYLETIFSLPWLEKNEKINEDVIDIVKAQKILDSDHYGLKDVKERIIEFLAVKKIGGATKGFIICFVGPPGVGKTSLGKSIAKTLNRKFYRFSLGGMKDEAEIKGHRRTYIGSMPGKIITALKITKSRNPVIMLDEIDKVGTHYLGDPASALLEVLDPEQNKDFRDHYLDLPFDISEVLFITTANTLDTIPPALKDRMEVIRLSGYISEDKIQIAKKFLIPKLFKKTGIKSKNLSFLKTGLNEVIESYSREAGVRNLEKNLEKIMRKFAVRLVKNEKKSEKIIKENVKNYLGMPKFISETAMKDNKPGIVTGLAWTAFGGEILFIETICLKGKGDIKITGQLGDVMKESANIAYSLARYFAEQLSLPKEFFNENIIHIHVPAGATPKDGPSAGITLTTAVLSLILKKKVDNLLSMTGEVSLSGRVLPIGGLKEKVIAAKRAKLKKIIIPFDNNKDLEEIPDYIKKGIKFYPVKLIDEVLKITNLI